MQWLLLFIILVLFLIYVLRKKLVLTLNAIISGVFVVSLIISIIGVFFQTPFTYLANRSLENNGTLETVRKIDGNLSLDSVKNAGNSIVDSLKKLFGQEPSSQQPTQQSKGIIEKEVYPGMVTALAALYRTLAVIVSIALMAISIYLSFSTASASEVEQLKQRIQALEEKIPN